MMHNGTIISTVNERATRTANAELMADAVFKNGPEGFKRWEKHWLDTGRLWESELRAEGLTVTADTLAKHLKWFEDRANAG